MSEKKSISAFNKRVGTIGRSASQNIEDDEVSEDALNGATIASNAATSDPTTALSYLTLFPLEGDFLEKGSDESTEDSSESENSDLLGEDVEYNGSDVHDEYIELRAEKRSFQRRKRRERIPADTENVPCGEVGPDMGFDETETGKKSLKGRLGGDEPYYLSSDACSFEIDEVECWLEDEKQGNVKLSRRRSSSSKSVIFDPTCKKVVWQLGMIFESVEQFRNAVTKYALQKRVQIEKHVNEPTRVRVRCKDNCPWLLYASLDSVSNNFVIRTYKPIHKCKMASRNYLCNSKFLASVFKDRITEQPNIRVFKLQELVKKKFKVHVGKTIARRARAKTLKQIIGDHIVEFGRILDYRN